MEELEHKIEKIKLKNEKIQTNEKVQYTEEMESEQEETEKKSNKKLKQQKNKNKKEEKKKNKQKAKSKKEKNDNIDDTMNDNNNNASAGELDASKTDKDEANENDDRDQEKEQEKEKGEKFKDLNTGIDETNKVSEKKKKVILPVLVDYCKICGMPYEYCEFGNFYDECKEENKDKYNYNNSGIIIDTEIKKKVKRPEKTVNTKITIQKISRAKKKVVTVVTGLHAYVKLDKMSKIFSKTFACGSSVIKGTNNFPDHVDIQGDVGHALAEVIMKNCPEITEDKFVVLSPK